MDVSKARPALYLHRGTTPASFSRGHYDWASRMKSRLCLAKSGHAREAAKKKLSSAQPQSEQATQRYVAGGNPNRQKNVAGWEPRGQGTTQDRNTADIMMSGKGSHIRNHQ